MEIEGLRCLVTGGTHGIGAATARLLAQHGARLAVVSRNADAEAMDLQAEIRQSGRQCEHIQMDLQSGEGCRSAVLQAAQQLGGLEALVHSAGGPVPGSILEVSEEAWLGAFDLHVHAVFHLARAVAPYQKRAGYGADVLVSSAAGLRGCAGAAAYGVVKGTLPQFTRVLARDLAEDNIRVNCVAPGIIRTRFHQTMTPEAKAHNLNNRVPLHSEGSAGQVASVIRMLLANDYITGETVTIDGGLTMRIA
ncbi:MAG: SDR family oxidoreductase [Armatimonadetes bacterium]|nr:SDR family oxidoreductase [Armatimonadota bacterium]MDE2207747.1 SDR family oxidoreductase [Armatimonadota bacterium]